MGREQQGVTIDTIDAWKELVTLSRSITQPHPAKVQAFSTEDMTAIVNERLAGTFTTSNIRSRIMALKHAFASSPTRPPILGFSIRHEDDRFQHVNFAAEYSALHFLNALLEDAKFKWVSDWEIEVQEPFFFWIKSDGVSLDTLMEYKFTKEEAEWELPQPYPQLARQIRRGKAPTAEHELITSKEPVKIAPASKPARQERPKAAVKAPKPSAEGLITIGDVAAEYGFDAKQARGIMRQANITKPDHGRWEWEEVPVLVRHAFEAAKKAKK